MYRLASQLKVLVIAAGVLTLAACDTVEFQSPPSEPLLACDPAFVGDWRVEDLQHDHDTTDQQYLRVTADCDRWYSVEVERGDDGAWKPDVDDIEADMALGFAKTATQTFVAARDQPDPAAESTPQDKPNGYTLIAYDHADDTLTLRQIDLKATAHLIVDGVVPGWIDKRDRRPDGSKDGYTGGFWVYVFGTADDTRRLLEKHDLLDAPWMRMVKLDAAGSAELDQWMAEAAAHPSAP